MIATHHPPIYPALGFRHLLVLLVDVLSSEYLSRISDLEGRLALLKHQGKSALDQAGKSYSLMRQVSALEDKSV
jgi:hypothetical protein